jgi:hypothetical protein
MARAGLGGPGRLADGYFTVTIQEGAEVRAEVPSLTLMQYVCFEPDGRPRSLSVTEG